MENLTKSFKAFLDGGARENLLSEEFKHDMETQMGEISETSMEPGPSSYREIKGSQNVYAPDHELISSENEEDKSSVGSYTDPLDDETRSILGDLERIVTEVEDDTAWEGSSHIVWTSPGIYPSHEEFTKAKVMLKSLIKSINRDSGSSYIVNVGRPDTLFVTRADSLTVSRAKGVTFKGLIPPPTPLIDEDQAQYVIQAFAKGLKLRDKDEPDRFLTVTTNTPGFSDAEIRRALACGKTTIRDILEYIWTAKGRWNYIRSSYDINL